MVLEICMFDKWYRELHQVLHLFAIFNGTMSSQPIGKLITSRNMNLPCKITGAINPSGSYRLFKHERISLYVGEKSSTFGTNWNVSVSDFKFHASPRLRCKGIWWKSKFTFPKSFALSSGGKLSMTCGMFDANLWKFKFPSSLSIVCVLCKISNASSSSA